MTHVTARRRATRGGLAGLAVVALALGAGSARAAAKADSSAALRRACATGALTAYACAQRGIKTEGAPPATAPSTPPPAPAAAAAPPAAVAPPPTAAAPPPAGRGSRRGRAETAAMAPASAPSIRPFHDTKNRYDLEIPEGWALQMQGSFAAFANGADWIQLRHAPVATVPAAVNAGLDMLRGEYAQLQTTADAPVQVGGRAGRRLVISARSKGGRPSALVLVTAPINAGESLVVLGGGSPEELAKIDAGVTALVGRVRFR